MYEPRWNSAVSLDRAGSVLLKGLKISVLLLAVYIMKYNNDCGIKMLF